MMKPEHWVSPRSLRCNGGNNGVRRTRRFRAATQRRERARLGNRRSKWTWKCPPRSSLWRARRGSIPMTNQPERGGRGRNAGPGRRRRRSSRRACDVTGRARRSCGGSSQGGRSRGGRVETPALSSVADEERLERAAGDSTATKKKKNAPGDLTSVVPTSPGRPALVFLRKKEGDVFHEKGG